MAQPKQIKNPTALRRQMIEEFCDSIQAHLTTAMNAAGGSLKPSPEVAQHVARRTAPSSLHKHTGMDSAVMNYVVDLWDLATRIRRYQFIERYRDLATSDNKDLAAALLEHTHALKSHEVYVVLERGSKLLKFGFALSTNLGLAGIDNSNRYLKALKKEFEYRLRERHRMVHY